MAQYFEIHPGTPQPRLIAQAARILEGGGVIVYPTDTTYGLGCDLLSKQGVERIRALKKIDDKHQLSLICPDLSDLSTYAKVDNPAFRILKHHLPGPYTFILEATREVPKLLQSRRKTIGLRVPDHSVCQALLRALGRPILSTTVALPGEEALTDPLEIRNRLEKQVDLVIDGGILSGTPSSVVDLTCSPPEVVRSGAGDISEFI
ncbi:MAG: threonylcarbamoyl-AMP synthase [Alphaproteobacteria bacterium CG_4_10_14_0_2_um_filter_63_37]|nr:MAG: threonylcarbamoyl-AMP synthase [Proteobacteria bacterium CG1_02_64_396]PJA25894.1 MAG: threonylcarbamoyl-AMP synthase [Alphaproteobacteria bacterium CG_4_10_14_0_2_um_filter_63_37]